MNDNNLSQELQDIGTSILEFIPNIIAALVILLIGYLIGLVLSRAIRKGLKKLRFDRAVHSSPIGTMVSRVVDSPAYFTGKLAFWLVMIGAISLAVTALDLPVLNDLLASVYGYVPNIIAAVIIFLIASAVSAGAAKFVQRVMGRTAMARLIATVIPTITMVLAVFMILNQLQIATDIVNILFTAIVGSVALGLALAFGLGGRDVARQLLEQASDAARANKQDVKSEMQSAADNAERVSM